MGDLNGLHPPLRDDPGGDSGEDEERTWGATWGVSC